jgi:Holliday junction resolvase RusA-like endonuclease
VTHTLALENWHPVRINQWIGEHWRVRHKLANDQAAVIALEARNAGIPKATGRRRVSLELHGWPRGRFPDRDAFDKLLLDALVKAGLLTDDSDEGLAGRMEVNLVRSKIRRTILTLEE